MNVLQAIRWGIDAWEQDVTETTINNCWVKSRVLSAKYGPVNREEAENMGWHQKVKEDNSSYDVVISSMAQQIHHLVHQDRIAKAMSITQFLNPQEEDVYDTEEVLIDDIVNSYSREERAYETNEEDVIMPRIRHNEAILALQTLRLYEEQQDEGDSELISRINRHERVIRQRTKQGLKQTTIDSYLT